MCVCVCTSRRVRRTAWTGTAHSERSRAPGGRHWYFVNSLNVTSAWRGRAREGKAETSESKGEGKAGNPQVRPRDLLNSDQSRLHKSEYPEGGYMAVGSFLFLKEQIKVIIINKETHGR